MVTVFEEGKKRVEWKTAVVESLVKGKGGVGRGANVRAIVKGKITRLFRPIQKLYPLEIRTNSRDEGGTKLGEVSEDTKTVRRNPGTRRTRL